METRTLSIEDYQKQLVVCGIFSHIVANGIKIDDTVSVDQFAMFVRGINMRHNSPDSIRTGGKRTSA